MVSGSLLRSQPWPPGLGLVVSASSHGHQGWVWWSRRPVMATRAWYGRLNVARSLNVVRTILMAYRISPHPGSTPLVQRQDPHCWYRDRILTADAETGSALLMQRQDPHCWCRDKILTADAETGSSLLTQTQDPHC